MRILASTTSFVIKKKKKAHTDVSQITAETHSGGETTSVSLFSPIPALIPTTTATARSLLHISLQKKKKKKTEHFLSLGPLNTTEPNSHLQKKLY